MFYKQMPTYNPQGLIKLDKPVTRTRKDIADIYRKGSLLGDYITTHTNYPKNLLQFKCERGYHSTQKPVPLFEYLIKTYTNEGELVLDATAGSCTTAVGCINTNRDYICFELDEEIYNTGVARVDGHRGE